MQQTYGHLLNEILRSGEFDADLLKTLQHADDYILDNTPIVDKRARMYGSYFTNSPILSPIESIILFLYCLYEARVCFDFM